MITSKFYKDLSMKEEAKVGDSVAMVVPGAIGEGLAPEVLYNSNPETRPSLVKMKDGCYGLSFSSKKAWPNSSLLGGVMIHGTVEDLTEGGIIPGNKKCKRQGCTWRDQSGS